MKKLFKKVILTSALLVVGALGLSVSGKALAATSPALTALTGYSVLGGAAVTCTGAATTTGAVGVSTGTSITGFPTPCTAGGGTHPNDASAIAAQAETLTTFGALDQTCDHSYGAQDLTALSPLAPGVYCSTSSFSLSGNLALTGSGVWIFKTVSTLITSPASSVTGGDPCNVWWRVGSAATFGTTTSFLGTIIAQNGTTALNTGAILNGRVLALTAGTVTLNANTITGPTCASTTPPDDTGDTTPPPVAGGGTTGTTTAPGVPDTGFGIEATNAWRNFIIYGIGAVSCFGLAIAARRLAKKQ